MTKPSWRDRRAAAKWVMRMLDNPRRHQAGLERWIAARAGRQSLYDQLLANVHGAGHAAAIAALRVGQRAAAAPKWRPALAAAAIMMVIAVASVMMLFNASPAHKTSVGDGELATRIGEVREVRLEDGSILFLDTGTAMNIDLSTKQRVIRLAHGRARFTIAPDAARAFIVRVGQNDIISRGPIFDVSYGHRIAVHVISGDAEVQTRSWRDNASAERRFHLHPGEQLSFLDGQATAASVMSARPLDEQWVTGVKNLDDVPIGEVIAEANSYSSTQIVLADPAWSNREIFGSVHIRDIDAVADAIATFLKARVDRSHPGKLIITK